MSPQLRFQCGLEGMLKVIRDAADPSVPEWQAYRGCMHREAYRFVREMVRQARGLGLLVDEASDTSQLVDAVDRAGGIGHERDTRDENVIFVRR